MKTTSILPVFKKKLTVLRSRVRASWRQLWSQHDWSLKDSLLTEYLHALNEGNEERVKGIFTTANFLVKPHDERQELVNRALLAACASGQRNIVEFLLSSSKVIPQPEIGFISDFERSALEQAAKQGHVDIVHYLLNAHNLPRFGRSLQENLQNAMEAGEQGSHLEVVHILLPLMPADWKGGGDWHDDLAGKLEVKVKDFCERQEWEHAKRALRSLNMKCRPINIQQRVMNHVLWQASQHGSKEMVEWVLTAPELVENGHPLAQANGVTSFGHTCLSMAFKAGHMELAKQLLYDKKLGVDLHAQGEAALVAACHGGQLAVVQYLSASPEITKHHLKHAVYNESCLMAATYQGHLPVVEYLLTSPEIRHPVLDFSHHNHFIGAFAYGHFHIVRYMLSCPQVTVNHPNIHEGNDSCLVSACEHGYLEMVKFLLTSDEIVQAGGVLANVHHNADAALKKALKYGHMDIVNYLLFEYGIQQTPEIEAFSWVNPRLKSLLEKRQLNEKLHTTLEQSPRSNVLKKI